MLGNRLDSLPDGGVAVVVGASGGIGAALAAGCRASGRFARVLALSRQGDPSSGLPGLDLTDETGIAALAEAVAALPAPPRLLLVASGFLHGGGFAPEKALRALDPAQMAHAFAVNAIGPALLMKHLLPLLPLLPRTGKSVFAALSARVGSIGDNRLGGWYSYRASKAALNQIVRTAAIELHRRQPEAICVALHPGTVDTGLSAPFARTGLTPQTPAQAAGRLLSVIDRLGPEASGGFFDHHGEQVAW